MTDTDKPMPPRRKKLIEVALPLEAINKASAREKSIRHGHPSTLHLWWARRPLAACRAVLFSSLVDDPDSDPAYHNDPEAAGIRRAELFDLIEELVLWENSNNTKVINRARAEIAASVLSRKIELGELNKDTIVFGKKEGQAHPDGPLADDRTTAWRVMLRQSRPEIVNHVLATYAPPVLDPFAGGGSIPLEAQRLGLRAHASDLNPVAVLINKALIEIPPKFANMPPVHPDAPKKTGWSGAQGLAEDVRRYGKWMRDEAEKRIGHLYPKVEVTEAMAKDRTDLKPYVGQELTVIAWLWARTVPSPNPAFSSANVPLISNFWLCKRKSSETWLCIEKDVNAVDGYRFTVKIGAQSTATSSVLNTGTKVGRGGNFQCVLSGDPIPVKYIREQGVNGGLRARMMAVVCEGNRERIYIDPDDLQSTTAQVDVPSDAPEQEIADNPRDIRCQLYGLYKFVDLFTPRQLSTMLTFSDLVGEVKNKLVYDAGRSGKDMAEEYSCAVATYLAFALSKATDRNNSLCSWEPGMGRMGHLFSRQAIPMVWDYTETNPLAGAGGDLYGTVHSLCEVLDKLLADTPGLASHQNATMRDYGSGDTIVSSDPPYYDNINYADLSDFFYVWLRRSLRDTYPQLLSTLLTPKAEELVASAYRHNGDKARASDYFEQGLGNVIGQWCTASSGDYPTTIFYAFKQSEVDGKGGGWSTFLSGVIDSGFCITSTWPMRTELSNRIVGMGTNALASSIVLSCIPRRHDAPMATRREFADALRSELPQAIRHLQSGNVAPVDLTQAAIGPGMEAFSRYSKVVNADGSPMSVREALQLINQVLDEVLAEQESDFDSETRFAVKWFEQYAMKEGPFGDAETLAKAMAVSVQGVVTSGVARSGAGKVRLLKRDELDPVWDPQADGRLTIWEVTQHLIRELEENGEAAAAGLLRKVGAGAGETARELAYRLYQTCERKKWADEARAYNGLVVSWPEIERLSREQRGKQAEQQADMFA